MPAVRATDRRVTDQRATDARAAVREAFCPPCAARRPVRVIRAAAVPFPDLGLTALRCPSGHAVDLGGDTLLERVLAVLNWFDPARLLVAEASRDVYLAEAEDLTWYLHRREPIDLDLLDRTWGRWGPSHGRARCRLSDSARRTLAQELQRLTPEA